MLMRLQHDDGREQSCVLVDRASLASLLDPGVGPVLHAEEPLGQAIDGAPVGEVQMYLAGGRVRSVTLTSIGGCA